MNNIVERLRDQGLVIQHPERKQIADLIEQQAARIAELERELMETDDLQKTLATAGQSLETHLTAANQRIKELEAELAALRKRIDDAPVVAWEYSLCDDAGVIARQASEVNWDERYQPYGRPGIDYSAKARATKKALISKEDLQK